MVSTPTLIMSEFNGRRVGSGIRVVNDDSSHGEEDTRVYQEVEQLSYNDEIDGATQNGLREGEDTERAEDAEYFDQQGMDQEMRDLADLQEQWQNRRDLGASGQINQYQPGMMAYPPEEENPVMATLLIAQHEWRKVLDGSTGNTTGRPMLPVTEAMSNTYWGDACQDKASTVFSNLRTKCQRNLFGPERGTIRYLVSGSEGSTCRYVSRTGT
jgi:hypothetical protein